MKNEYIEKLITEKSGKDNIEWAEFKIVQMYKRPDYVRFGRFCMEEPIHNTEDAEALVQQLSLAGVDTLYVTGEYSNEFAQYAAMDEKGLKLVGIVTIENGRYHEDMENWGNSFNCETVPALKFSFCK